MHMTLDEKKFKITKGMFEWVHMLHFAMVWWFPF